MDVDAWIELKVAGEWGDLVRSLVALGRKTLPAAKLSIKWGQPVFEENGPVAFIKPAKAHVTFGFWRGGALNDPMNVLEGGDVMRHVKVRAAADIRKYGLADMLLQAAKLNKTMGDPTLRHKR